MKRHERWSEPTDNPLNKDKLTTVSRQKAADAAHHALFGIQDLDPELQVIGIATLFAAYCQRCQLDPEQMHNAGRRVLRDDPYHKVTNDALQSLKDFMGLRVVGEDISYA